MCKYIIIQLLTKYIYIIYDFFKFRYIIILEKYKYIYLCLHWLNFYFHLFLLVRGQLLYNIVVVFAIHWHESAMDLYVFPIPIPPPASLPIPSLWVFPVHQPWALVPCIQPGLVISLTLDSILVSMIFSQNFPPSPSTESKSLLCTSVSLFLFCI